MCPQYPEVLLPGARVTHLQLEKLGPRNDGSSGVHVIVVNEDLRRGIFEAANLNVHSGGSDGVEAVISRYRSEPKFTTN